MNSPHKQTAKYLINSLKCEIDSILPIRRAYTDLQSYHLKISTQLQVMLQEHEGNVSELTIDKLKQQNIILGHLGQEKQFLIKRLKQLQNSQAEGKMEKKNLLSKSESLSLHENLQRDQNHIRRSRKQQNQHNLEKLKANIQATNRCNQQLQSSIKQKNQKRIQFQDQIKRRQNFNQKLQNNLKGLQKSLENLGLQNQNKANRNQTLGLEMNELDNQIQKQQRRKLSLNQQLIQKNQLLNRLKNEKQYYLQKLQNEINSNQIIATNEERFNSIIMNRKRQLENVNNDITQLKELINQQNIKYQQNQKSKEYCQTYMIQLMEANSLIIQKMEDWCRQDIQVIKVIQQKSNKLRWAVNKTRNILGQRQLNAHKIQKNMANTKSTLWRSCKKQN